MIKQDFQNLDDQNYLNDELIDEIVDELLEVLNVLVYFLLFNFELVQFYQLEHEMILDIYDHLEVKTRYVVMKLLLVVQQDL
jgi:hypothetical protein